MWSWVSEGVYCVYCYTWTICYSVILHLKHHPTFCQRVLCKNTQESSLYPTGAKQNWKRDRAGLFKGLKKRRPDAELCGIPFIPSTQCPGQWYLSNIRWAGEILGLIAGSAEKICLLPWTLMSDIRNEMLPLRPDTITTDWINIYLSLLFQLCFIGDYVAWCDIKRHHVTTVQCRGVFILRDEKIPHFGINCMCI